MAVDGLRVVAMVQARMGSARLPGKVLAHVGGEPMVLRIANAISAARSVDTVALSTSTDPSDDELAQIALNAGLEVQRGDADDIVGRLTATCHLARADVLVRVWGDCPFVDAGTVDAAVDLLVHEAAEFVTNASNPRTYPAGFDVEAYRRDLLEVLDSTLVERGLREFPAVAVGDLGRRTAALHLDTDWSAVRLTVDYPDDLDAARRVVDALDRRALPSSLGTILDLFAEDPDLLGGFVDAPRNVEYQEFLRSRSTRMQP